LIIDLKNLKTKNKITSKICIIGGGTAGLFLAHTLRLKKIPVTILEAGGEVKNETRNFEYEFKNRFYKLASLRGKNNLGGSTKVWGGQMIPFQKKDLQKRDYLNLKSWVIKYNEIYKYFSFVKKSFEFEFIKNTSDIKINKNKYYNFAKKYFNLRFSTFIKPKIKNFYKHFYQQIKKDINLNIYTNAKVKEISNKLNNLSVKKIIAESNNGNILEIEADIFVICCGTLESTRLLLNYNKKNNNLNKNQKKILGRFFTEQLSINTGRFIIKDLKKFILYFSPLYSNGLIHSPRLELKYSFQKNNNIQNACCNFDFYHKKFYWLNLIKKISNIKKINFKLIKYIVFVIPQILEDFYNLFFFRVLNKSVWFNKPHNMLFSITLEQLPGFNNKLLLKKNINNPDKLVIDWKIKKKNINTIKLITNSFKDLWEKSKLNEIAEFKLKKLNNLTIKDFKECYHPTGTIRIGSSRMNSILNKNLKLWSLKNLYVCSTAIFPTSGCSNTGFTLLALTARLGDYLKNNLNKKR
jgi:hypothetical protein